MKIRTKKYQASHRHKTNNRWKWMAGATAATAAGVTTSQAGLVTITLSNNYISATGGNHLNADLTGDGHPDLMIANAAYFYSRPSSAFTNIRAFANVDLNGVHAHAYFNGYPYGTVKLGSRRGVWYPTNYLTSYLTGSIPITFKDLHINGGALTEGSLQVTAFVFGPHRPPSMPEIQLDTLTYNTRNNVPDQGSSLALLAMGAGGILAFRRWRRMQDPVKS